MWLRKIGKSSLIGRLQEEYLWPIAVVDLEGYIGGLQYIYKEALDSWQTAIRAKYPNLELPKLATIDTTTNLADLTQQFRLSLDLLLQVLNSLPNKTGLVLVLDEIDIVLDQDSYFSFAATLRSLVELDRYRSRFVILVSGLDLTLNRVDRIGNIRNPFFNFFVEMPVGLLELDDARTMVVSIGGQMGISYTESALSRLVTVGGGHAFLIRQLCSQTIKDLKRPATIDDNKVIQAIHTYLELPHNYLAESLWGIDTNGPPEIEATILKKLAVSNFVQEDLFIANLPPLQRREFQITIESLQNQGLVQLTERGWELTIPLYHQWIRHYILDLPEG